MRKKKCSSDKTDNVSDGASDSNGDNLVFMPKMIL